MVHVDLVWPYMVMHYGVAYMLTAMSMINPVTSWLEISQVPVYQYHDPKKKDVEMCMDVTSSRVSQLFNDN
eukprot:6525880-Ditylum_brightwellii.AAC.1